MTAGTRTQSPGEPLGLDEVVLPAAPGLGALYVRGAAASGRLALTRRLGRAPRGLPEVAYVVAGVRADADHLTAYQHLLGESASDELPAGFVHVLAFPVTTALMARPDFPLPLAGMVHLANHVTQHAPARLGDALDVRAWAQSLRPHRSGTQVELVTEARLGGPSYEVGSGPLLWRGVSTYLAKGVRMGAATEAAPGSGPGSGRASGPASAPDEDHRERFVAPVPTGRWSLDAGTGRRYAAISGDRNPIHLSALSAKALGFPRAIAHGMYTAARALATVGPARGDAFTWSVEFATPVLLPSSVAVRVAPAGAADSAGGGAALGTDDVTTGPSAFEVAVWDARTGKPHLSGRVTAAGRAAPRVRS